MNNSSLHKKFMRLAIEEARKGLGKVSPNPAVGCVIVKNNKVLTCGFHREFGGPHAEIMALKKAGRAARGSRLYVSLEPCSYFGKTPPCTEAIIRAGIREVIAAGADPNPANSGRGFKQLRKNGIRVISGILKKEAEDLNRPFIERMKKRRPYITVKMAQSLDGKIATRTGDSKWISSVASRGIVQKLRCRHDAVMVGVNTVLRDNPRLNIRLSPWQPAKIVVDSQLRTPAKAKIFSSSPAAVIIATTKTAPKQKEKRLRAKGAEVLRLGADSARVDLKALMKELSRRGINSILVEGGGKLAASLFENKLVDRLVLFIAPVLVGGKDALTSLEGRGIERIKDAFRLDALKIKRISGDLMVEGDVGEPGKIS